MLLYFRLTLLQVCDFYECAGCCQLHQLAGLHARRVMGQAVHSAVHSDSHSYPDWLRKI
jgi:hypothetical protein